jgi:hypothetical protein
MKNNKKKTILLFCILSVFYFLSIETKAQGVLSNGSIHGNFQMDAQLYSEDTVINAPDVSEDMLMNGFANINYTNGKFTAGLRYEVYLNPMLGYDYRLKGSGIPYRFASFKSDDFEITVGNFYEQFGSGLVLRSYEEWNLGIDNSIDGINIKFKPFNGVTIKGVYGNQRYYWEKSKGIVRGIDGDFFVNDIFSGLSDMKTKISLGGSMVSVFQENDPSLMLNLPLNVAAFAGRMNVSRGKVSFMAEYANKINDPEALNNFIYKNGEALLVSGSYSKKGLGIMLSAKRIDNMVYKSDRKEIGNALDVNFLPPLTKQHVYSLATMYPYATQPNGEMGYQAQVIYTIPKKSKLGGRYGTTISVNYSQVNSIDKQQIDTIPIGEYGTKGYTSDFFKFGDIVYNKDFNIEISRKLNKKWKAILAYTNLVYNIEVVEGHAGEPSVYSDIFILDITHKFTPTKALRLEYQQLFTKQDEGDWLAAMLEFTIAPKWFFSISDQYNYGNSHSDKKIHYYMAAMGYTKGTSRIALSYGRQREGLVCVGGVCRLVPASNGLTLTISSSF